MCKVDPCRLDRKRDQPYGPRVVVRAARRERRGWAGSHRRLTVALARLGALAGVLACAVACGPQIQVHSSFDPGARFETYGTFSMLEPDRAVPTDPDVDPFFMQRLRQIVREEMLQRGFREAPADQAQLGVGVMAVVRGRAVVYPRSFGYGYRWGHPWGHPWGGGYDVRYYDEGTIVIDLIDRQRAAVVWRGTGMRVVTRRTSEEDLREVIVEILAEYPPGEELE